MFQTNSSAGSANTIMTISSNGNIGINKSVPIYKLDIVGDINLGGGGDVLSNGSLWSPYPILSDTTSSVLYVGGKHHDDTENAAFNGSFHNSNNVACYIRLSGTNSSITNDLSGTIYAHNDSNS